MDLRGTAALSRGFVVHLFGKMALKNNSAGNQGPRHYQL
jgi:hypothetical protein